ncbi:molybdate ABC transporter permease subunit [Massilia sp. Dwa41.01b]|uniref:molybdate ABC transporter permease subunit n=1 Tax=unclassified Massilia TaxID=2609279 RepID=UPI001600A81D|nr:MULTISPECIES: molybdate ABC transporter permease subunit [unclassified Massilia]QNA87413.1 molybdate ABC transporter permease subunit [Massilia sp. Dwa41.01b]QNA98319.1 molybdate ABC transporter permease subunit [Massilia sp. Se16.2.3]
MTDWQFPPELWDAIGLTLRLAAVTSIVLLVIGIPLANWLNNSRMRGIIFIETLVSLPIVLPPTVIGFYLLTLMAPTQPVGAAWLKAFGHPLPFSFAGLVAGSVLYSLPFAVQPFQAAFRGVGREMVQSALALGLTRRQAFWSIVLPLSKHGILTGVSLSFAHTMGEFGVVLMLGGNIPGQTRVASIALYDEAQKLNYGAAHAYALVLLAISFAILVGIAFLQRRQNAILLSN